MHHNNDKSHDYMKLREFQTIISKMPLAVCCAVVLPELSITWKEVARAVRSHRLRMEPGSVARVLCQYLATTNTHHVLDQLLPVLKLHLAARQTRTWHVVHLSEPLTERHIELRAMPRRFTSALTQYRKDITPEVHSIMLDDLVYFSIQVSGKSSNAVYLATAPGQPVLLVSPSQSDKLLKLCAEALGYASYSRAELHGSHIPSLLRVADPAWGGAPDQLAGATPYQPAPTVTATGIDYTRRGYDEQYVDSILGPNPPLITTLKIKTTSDFFDRSLLNKTINLTLNLKSDNIAHTFKGWVIKGAIAPNSEFLNIFHKIKSNKITFTKDGSDSD